METPHAAGLRHQRELRSILGDRVWAELLSENADFSDQADWLVALFRSRVRHPFASWAMRAAS